MNDASVSQPNDHPSLQVASTDVEKKLAQKMQSMGRSERETQVKRRASGSGFPHISLEKFPVSQNALRQISQEDAKQFGVVCFYATPDEVRLGALRPDEQQAQELLYQIQERNHAHGKLYTISEDSLAYVLKLYDTLPIVQPVTKDISIKKEDLEKVAAQVSDFTSFQQALQKRSTTDLVTSILGAGFKLDASDVHVEAEEKRIVLRFRLDGILHDAAELPKEVFTQLVNRVKLVAGLKLNVTDKPQDGRFTIKLESGDVDVRVSTMPTVYGESIVMRLLHQSRKGLAFDDLGLVGEAYEQLRQEIMRPNGMIITTGPTGSGKTTTMYAIMQILNKPGVKIITLEDPVEYRMEGINQSQIDHAHDYTFAKGLKSIVRQDPDIAMVGEIRDLETAEIAIQAALTGHLILSTIHTNSAAGAIPRFLSMGVKPFLLAPSLNCVIGQRLVRRLRDDSKVEAKPTKEQEERIEKIIATMPAAVRAEVEKKPRVFYTAKEDEGDKGYKGRIGVYEVFTMTPEIEQMILSNKVSEYEIEKIAIEGGMVTMVQDGLMKALDGQTSLDEVFRVTSE